MILAPLESPFHTLFNGKNILISLYTLKVMYELCICAFILQVLVVVQ